MKSVHRDCPPKQGDMQSTKVDIHEQSLYRGQQDEMDNSSVASLPNVTDRIGEDDDEQEYNVDEDEYEEDSSSIEPEEDAADEEEVSSLVKESQMSLDELLASYGIPTSGIGHSPNTVKTTGSGPSQSVRTRVSRLANRNAASSAAAASTCTTAGGTNDFPNTIAGEESTRSRVDAKVQPLRSDPSEGVKKRTSDDATVASSTPPNKRSRRGPSSPDSTVTVSSTEPNSFKLPKPQSGAGSNDQAACDVPLACSIASEVQSTTAVSSSLTCSNSDSSQQMVVEQAQQAAPHHHQQHHHHHHQHQHRPRQLLSRSSHTSPTRHHHHRRLATVPVATAVASGTTVVVGGTLPLQSQSVQSGFPPGAANWPPMSLAPLRRRATSVSVAAETAMVPVEPSLSCVDDLRSEARRRVLPSVEQKQGLLLPTLVDDGCDEAGETNGTATRVFSGDDEGPGYSNEEEEEVVDDEDEEDDREVDGEASSVKVAVGASEDNYPERFWKRAIVDDDSSHSYNSDEDEDYTPSSESGDDWRGEIRVGDEYQAQVPLSVSPCPLLVSDPASERDNNGFETAKRLWLPGRLSELDIVQYERLSAGNCSGSYPLPAQRTVDDEETLYLLMLCDFNVEEALERIAYRTAPPLEIPGYLETWSEADALAFEKGFITYNKDFRQIRETRLRHKTVGELVQYYYLWKKTARYDEFARVYRRDKKRSHPSITDFMDCLAVEQEKIAESYTAPNVAEVTHTCTSVAATATTTDNLSSSTGCIVNGQDDSVAGNALSSHRAPLPTSATGHPGGRFGIVD